MKYQGHSNESGGAVDTKRVEEYVAKMRRAMSDSAYSLPEASLRLPFDENLLKKSKTLASRLAGPKLSYILDIGIGGSNLGAKALYEATAGTLDAHTQFVPKILFADTCSPELLSDIVELLLDEVSDKDEIIIIVASKSGTTTETIINASVLVSALEQKFRLQTVLCVLLMKSHHFGLWERNKNFICFQFQKWSVGDSRFSRQQECSLFCARG